MSNNLKVESFYDSDTYTLSYLIYDNQTKDGIIVDPVLDYSYESGQVSMTSLEKLRSKVSKAGIKVRMILETHAHADHLSSSQFLKEYYPEAEIAISEKIQIVQQAFKPIFNLDSSFNADGSQFDRLLKDNELIKAGSLQFRVIETPGHTPACACFLFDNILFTGDCIFMPDYGTGRCDFPNGSAKELYNSIHEKLYKLPDETLVYVGHDYQPNGRELAYKSSIGQQKKENIQLRDTTSEDEFVTMRNKRDKGLKAPKLLLPSIQVNIKAGTLPTKENNGQAYLKIPIKIA